MDEVTTIGETKTMTGEGTKATQGVEEKEMVADQEETIIANTGNLNESASANVTENDTTPGGTGTGTGEA
jgi:hypothetical protein